jgi:hypothetical protein
MIAAAADCSGRSRSEGERVQAEAPAQGRADAEVLGQDLFEMIDRVTNYKFAHRGRWPASFREAGIDSLAPLLVRRLAETRGVVGISVHYRDTTTHAVTSCWGTDQVLEDAALYGGEFVVHCVLRGGDRRAFRVRRQGIPQ